MHTRNKARCTVVIVLLLLSSAKSTVGQNIPPPHLDTALVATIRALKDSQIARTAALGSRSQGRVLLPSDSVVNLASGDTILRVPIASVDTLWVRGSSLKKGLIWGAGIGALSGLATGVIINQAFCQDSDSGCEDEDVELILVSGLLGLGAGTLSGAIIGALIPRWDRRWP
jgi:hypothetical protein